MFCERVGPSLADMRKRVCAYGPNSDPHIFERAQKPHTLFAGEKFSVAINQRSASVNDAHLLIIQETVCIDGGLFSKKGSAPGPRAGRREMESGWAATRCKGVAASVTTSERKNQMVRKFKFLGLALAAVFAMSAVGASAASATVEFHSEGAPVTLTGNQEGESNAFDVQFGEVKCKTAKYNGTTTGTTDKTVTVTPSYNECTFAGVATIIDMNGCDYLIHVNNEGPPYKGTVDVVCPEGAKIVVTGGNKCTVDVGPQTGLGPITFTNIGTTTTREVTLGLSGITNITYTQTKGTAAVGACTTQTTGAGKYTGTATVTGETDPGGVHTGLFVA